MEHTKSIPVQTRQNYIPQNPITYSKVACMEDQKANLVSFIMPSWVEPLRHMAVILCVCVCVCMYDCIYVFRAYFF